MIEILSPSNKVPGPGRDLYLKKQEELRQGGVSLVEINLNRTGNHVFMVPFNRIPEGQPTPYAACIRRAWKPFELEYYRLPLRERLPAIAIPLRPNRSLRPTRPPGDTRRVLRGRTIPRRHRLPRRSRPATYRRRRPMGRRIAPRARPSIACDTRVQQLADRLRLMIRSISTKITEKRLPS